MFLWWEGADVLEPDSKGFDVVGVIGLVGWLEEGSLLSSLVRFFLRKFRLGI